MANHFIGGKFYDPRAVGLSPGAALYTYAAGTLTPLATYTDAGAVSANTNPVILNAYGQADVFLSSSAYRFRLYTDTIANGGTLLWDEDNIFNSYTYARTAHEIAAGVTPTDYSYQAGNVLRYGADRTGATSSQTAFDAAKNVAKRGLGEITIPWGDYKVNWLFTDSEADYIWIKTDGFRTRLLPVSSASPVIDIYGSAGGGGVTGLRMESMLIDSQLSGVATGAGVGVRVRAANPGFVWKCRIGHIYIRGFDDGFVIDCDVNLGEVFDNDFDQIEVLSCDDRSLDIKGIYNRFGRIFVTESGNYAMINASSACTFEQITTDGPMTFSGAGGVIDEIVIEGTNGVGATSAVDISGPNYTFGNVILKDLPSAKYTYGVGISGASTGLLFNNISISGATYPPTPILLGVGSSGVIGSASIPGGTKISTSTSVASKWRFLGDVSSAFNGDRYLDPNLFVEYSTGRLNQLGGTRKKRLDVTYSASMTLDSSLAEHFSITATNGTAFTINAPTNPVDGSLIEITISNTSGGALGAITWNAAFKMSAWTSPATGNNRSIRFRYNGTNWQEVSKTAADVPN